jgi:hypothetical protein
LLLKIETIKQDKAPVSHLYLYQLGRTKQWQETGGRSKNLTDRLLVSFGSAYEFLTLLQTGSGLKLHALTNHLPVRPSLLEISTLYLYSTLILKIPFFSSKLCRRTTIYTTVWPEVRPFEMLPNEGQPDLF